MMGELVVRNLLHRPLRTLIGVVAVAVEVALVVLIVGLTSGLLTETAKRIEGIGADIMVQPPSASVVVRTETPDGTIEAKAIQHLVAAAVPGMTLAAVTVLSTDGALLSSGEDQSQEAPAAMLAMTMLDPAVWSVKPLICCSVSAVSTRPARIR